jgi:hypothetical protein
MSRGTALRPRPGSFPRNRSPAVTERGNREARTLESVRLIFLTLMLGQKRLIQLTCYPRHREREFNGGTLGNHAAEEDDASAQPVFSSHTPRGRRP